MFNYCPKCQQPNISFINNHYFSCSICNFLYYHNTASAVAAIIECKGEILLTVRAKAPGKGLFDLPGGFVDHNESLEQALSREICEELSFKILPQQFNYFTSEPNTYNYQNIKYNTLDSIFTLTLEEKPPLIFETSEIIKASWVKKAEIDTESLAFSSIKRAISNYINLRSV